MKTNFAAYSLLLAITTSAHAQAGAKPAPAKDCLAGQLSVTTDSGNGEFDGMSHSGTQLVIRNTSSAACRVQSLPAVTMKGSSGEPLQVSVVPASNPFRGPMVNGKPVPMGHGPVVLPVTLQAGAQANSTLRWVSGEVYDHSVCVDVASASLSTADGSIDAPLAAHICGPDEQHVQITATRFIAHRGGKM